MWPFKKTIQPTPVKVGATTAVFSQHTKEWEFDFEGIAFILDKKEFDEEAVRWASDLIPMIRDLEADIVSQAKAAIDDEDGLINVDSVEMLSVDLTDYLSERIATINYTGDHTWGDLGVMVSLKDGMILGVDAGD